MDNVRRMMRLVGRVAIVGLVVVMILTAYSDPQGVHHVYTEKYDAFRNMLYLMRLWDFPPARYIQGLFDYFYWVDLLYLSVGTILILFRYTFGGWMLLLYLCIRFMIYFLPHLVGLPKIPFTVQERFEMMRQIGLMGAFLSLTCNEPTQIINQPSAQINNKNQ